MRLFAPGLLFALALILAACGGGGHTSVIPVATSTPAVTQSPGNLQSARTAMRLYVPPPAQQEAKHKFYVSSGTQSFAIAALPASDPSPPTLSQVQVFPVATPSPCAAASGGGLTCTFNVTAPVGTDVFYLAAFATASPGPSSEPLSSYVSGPVTVSLSPAPNATPLSFSMNGVVYTVAITVPSPDPSNTPNTQVLIAGVAASPLPLGITPYDASGNAILGGAFDGPLSIELTPTTMGVSFGLAASKCSPASSATATGVQIACAADLNGVTVAYNGTIAYDTNDNVLDRATITANQPAPSPTPAYVALAANVINYQINTTANAYQEIFLQALANGNVAYMLPIFSSNPAVYGVLNPTTGAVTQIPLGTAAPAQFYTASDGSIWVADTTLNAITCFGPAGGNPQATITLTDPVPNALTPYALTIDGAGNLWYFGYDAVAAANYVGYFPATAACGHPSGNSAVAQFQATSPYPESGSNTFMAPYASGGVAIDEQGTGAFYVATTSGITALNPGFSIGNGFGGGVAIDGTSKTYAAFDNTSIAYLSTLPAGGSTLTQYLTLPSSYPGALAGFGPGSSFDRLAWSESYDGGALGVIEGVNGSSPLASLIVLPNPEFPQPFPNVVYSTSGDPLIGYENLANATMAVSRAILTTTWSVPVTTTQGGYFSIDERGDSGPFTVTPAGTPPSCYTGVTPLTGTDHVFNIGTNLSGSGGTCTVPLTIVDKNGRSQTVTISTNIVSD
jgi:hypothetical protein